MIFRAIKKARQIIGKKAAGLLGAALVMLMAPPHCAQGDGGPDTIDVLLLLGLIGGDSSACASSDRLAYTRLQTLPGPTIVPQTVVVDASGANATTVYSNTMSPVWSTDGTQLAYWNMGDSMVYIGDATGSSSVLLGPTGAPSLSGPFLAWSADGASLYVADGTNVWRYFLHAGYFSFYNDSSGLMSIAADPYESETLYATIYISSQYYLAYSMDGGQTFTTWGSTTLDSPGVAPLGFGRVLLAQSGGDYGILNIYDGSFEFLGTCTGDSCGHFTLSPDRNRFAYVRLSGGDAQLYTASLNQPAGIEFTSGGSDQMPSWGCN